VNGIAHSQPGQWRPPLAYALRWRVAGVIPGAHPGSDSGQSGYFRQIVPFDRSPDPRRLDLRATLRDPFGALHVRQFEQRASARVEMIVDASASMAFGGKASNFALAVELASAVARAAHEIHDAIGLAVCGQSIELEFPARRGDPRAMIEELASMQPLAHGANGLIQAAERMVGRRRLVFVLSDFAFPLEALTALLDALSSHDVVPVVFADDAERRLPSWGLAELTDLESGRRRLVLLRPTLRAQWLRQTAERNARIESLCLSRGRRPFVLQGAFDAFALADYLLDT
jgi:uncharacterized protein (DUF58 family)